ncbi:proton-conducting transporter transmembrane domain-containing protein [Candidimonas nitroreducens]|nr:proton-conducting transporter membrane subunit [Candidimonas nitroreducens]
MAEGFFIIFVLLAAGLLAALCSQTTAARWLIAAGAAWAAIQAAWALHAGAQGFSLPMALAGQPLRFAYSTDALWLMLFGFAPAALAAALCTPARQGSAGWLFGVAVSLLGALGVYGAQDAYAFLIAWELMSLGGAVMLLSESLSAQSGQVSLFMLALLEVGAVALLLACLILGRAAHGGMDFAQFSAAARGMSGGLELFVGLLLLVGFGAKLGLLPFYEWFADAYAAGSGASGAILSGVVLNAAFFALARGLVQWLPGSGLWLLVLGAVVTAIGVLSAIFTVLHALQQNDWRALLSLSTAENASVAVTALGACLIFRENGHADLAALAWTVAFLHLAGHALAKGGLFLCADGIYRAVGHYTIVQRGWLRRAGLALGVGALCCAMSLAAIPPQMGFVSEWFAFQTVFQGFHLDDLGSKLILALAGAGLALTAAVALATFIKLFGVGLLGARPAEDRQPFPRRYGWCVLALGLGVLVCAAGLPIWIRALDDVDFAIFGAHGAAAMADNWILVPLTNTFAFISPSKLVVAMPLLAIIPLLLLWVGWRRRPRQARVWYGGMIEDPQRAATTSLSFANALRNYYSFIYRPVQSAVRTHGANMYFLQSLDFHHDVTNMFETSLFDPARNFVWRLAGGLRRLQSGDLNFYLSFIGILLAAILFLTLWQ